MKKRLIMLSLFFLILATLGQAQNAIVQNILNDVKVDSLVTFVKQLTGQQPVIIGGVPDTIYSRHKDQPGNEKAFQFVKQKFEGYGLHVDSLQFSATGKNLLGVKTGTLFPNKKFILGAHYDNLGGTVAPGADDNASGSAAVIEAARIFSNYSFPYTIIFALWDEEEQGLLGSNAHAALAASSGDSILVYINLDMLGWDGNNDSMADLHVRPVANSQRLADKATYADSVYAIGLSLNIVNPGTGNTDHAAFWNKGFNAIGINEQYDNDFNHFWHSPGDSLGHFNLPFFEKCAKLAYATLADCLLETNLTMKLTGLTANPKIKLYPNPASSLINIVLPISSELETCIQIKDVTGKIIYHTLYTYQAIRISDLENGIYFLTFFNNEFSQTQKFIVNK